jgi:DNA-binding IclR family transcriptional regulator
MPSSPARPTRTVANSALFLGTIAKGFQILEVLSAARRPIALKELSALAKMDRSAVQRVTHTLHALGYLRQDQLTRAYSLSGKVLEFGHAVLSTDSVRNKAMPHLEALNRSTGETVNLMELEDREIVYVARFPSRHPVSVDLHVGSRLPVYCSSAGRAILSRLDEETALDILAKCERVPMTPRTQTELPALRKAIAKARQVGYSLLDQEAFVGDISIGAPLVNRWGEPVGAINIALPSPRWKVDDVLRMLAPLLLRTARDINRAIS